MSMGALDWIGNKVSAGVDAVSDFGSDVVEAGTEVVTEAVDYGGEVVNDVVDAGGEVIQAGGEVVNDVVDYGGEVVNQAVDYGGEVVNDVVDAGGQVLDAGGEVINDVVDYGGQLADAASQPFTGMYDGGGMENTMGASVPWYSMPAIPKTLEGLSKATKTAGGIPFLGTIINGGKAAYHLGQAGIDHWVADDDETAKDHLAQVPLDLVKAVPYVGTVASIGEYIHDRGADTANNGTCSDSKRSKLDRLIWGDGQTWYRDYDQPCGNDDRHLDEKMRDWMFGPRQHMKTEPAR